MVALMRACSYGCCVQMALIESISGKTTQQEMSSGYW